MSYGIEQNVLQSPFSLAVSLILSLGVINIGTFVQKIILKNLKVDSLNFNIFFSPIIGIYFLLFPLYLSLIFEFYATYFIKFVSYLLIFLGICQIFKSKSVIQELKKNFQKTNTFFFIIFLFLLLFLISASPVTHADSLDYHFLGSLNLINFGHFQKEILPMHSNLISIGEIIISLGLVLKAEQFGAIMQMFSLLSIIPLFKNKNSFLLLILACPITFFLVSSPKPQLIFCISTFLIFVYLNNFSNKITKEQLKKIFPIIVFILSINSLVKYSFLLSSSLLGIYLMFLMYRNKLIIYSVIILFIITLFTFIPYWIFRFENFDTNIFDLIRSPLPINIYGYEKFHDLLKGGSISIPNIFFPKNLQTFSTTYGPLVLLFPFFVKKEIFKFKIEIFIIMVFFINVLIFGSNLPRFLFEGFLWLTYLVSKNTKLKSNFFNIFRKSVFMQVLIMIIIYSYFVLTIFPASIFETLKPKVLSKTVNGYELSEWVNKKLDKKDVLLSTHRSISLYKNKTYSNLYARQIDTKNKKSNIYFNFLKKEKVNKILFYGNKLDKDIYKNCLGKLLYFKENVGRHVGRNPFNKKKLYDGWIFEFNYKKLPGCIVR